MPKLFIGPMSKNIVDSICRYTIDNQIEIGLIPSRRQIEHDGGYVNKWTTREFTKYVRSTGAAVILERDHGGPNQGNTKDDGKESFEEDCANNFDLIHIDPWKKYTDINAAATQTVIHIRDCISQNSSVGYEVGTEAAIRPYTAEEFQRFLSILENELKDDFQKIKYAVIQSGTAIVGNTNVGVFNKKRCEDMSSICNKFGLKSKEHNGDYLTRASIDILFECGLDAINIAPEFGYIETQTILNEIYNNLDHAAYEKFYNLCERTKAWIKWLPPHINDVPLEMKKIAILRAAGHYVFGTTDFKNIKSKFEQIDKKIQDNVTQRISEIIA